MFREERNTWKKVHCAWLRFFSAKPRDCFHAYYSSFSCSCWLLFTFLACNSSLQTTLVTRFCTNSCYYVTFNVKSFKNIYEILRICLAWKSVKLTRLHKDKMCLHRTKNVNNCQTIIAMMLSLKSLAQWNILPNHSIYAWKKIPPFF